MRITLFALTGMGNHVLRALLRGGEEVVAIITRPEAHEFPYFRMENLATEAGRFGIPVTQIGSTGRAWHAEAETCAGRSDLVLVATFNRIIPVDRIVWARSGAYNIHPSLLPRHKGPRPVFWTVRCGDSEYGFSVHRLTSRVDEGEVYFQRRLRLGDVTMGAAFQDLCSDVERQTPAVLAAVLDRRPIDIRGEVGEYEPRPTGAHLMAELTQDGCRALKSILSLLPFPGVWMAGDGGVVRICGAELLKPGVADVAPGTVVERADRWVVIAVGLHRLRLAVGDGPLPPRGSVLVGCPAPASTDDATPAGLA